MSKTKSSDSMTKKSKSVLRKFPKALRKASSSRTKDAAKRGDITLETGTRKAKRDGQRKRIEVPDWRDGPVSLGDFLKTEFHSDERSFFMKPVLPHPGTLMLFGETGIGKSRIAFSIACAVASGKSMFGLPNTVAGCRVLYVDGENGAEEFHARCRKVRPGTDAATLHENVFLRVCIDELRFGPSPGKADRELEKWIDDIRPGLVILDAAQNFIDADENRADKIRPILDRLQRLCYRQNASLLLVHHSNKASQGGQIRGARGSSVFGDWATSIIEVTKGSKKSRIKLSFLKVRSAKPPASVELTTEDGVNFSPVVVGGGKVSTEKVVDELRLLLGEQKFVLQVKLIKTITKNTKASKSTVERAVKLAAQQNLIVRKMKKGKWIIQFP